jgi:hypothetical protein
MQYEDMENNAGIIGDNMNTDVDTSASPSLDLPPQIQAIVDMPAMGSFDMPQDQQNTYQEGGMVQPAGLSMQPQQGPTDGRTLDMQIQQMVSQNPEVLARIRAGVEAGIQSGELNLQELNMAVELAKVVLQNPAMYPQIRQFAIQKGLATEQDVPAEYDEGLLIALIIVGKSLDADINFGGAPTQQMKDGGQLKEVPEGNQGLSRLPEDVRNRMGYMQDGGVLKGPSHEDGGIPVKVAGVNNAEMEGGEYVIPKHVVMAKGTEFFDKMLANYEDKG